MATPQPTAPAKTATQQARVGDFELRHAWLEPLDTPAADAAQLSLPGTPAPTWPKIALPATVFAGWLQQHPDVDPFFGDNFRKLPGVNFPVATNYSYLDIPEESPFYRPSIYLLPFELPELDDDRRVRLHVKGINYRANIWLNGTSVGNEAEIRGPYAEHRLDITAAIRRNQSNRLALQVFAPTPQDLAITYVDWMPLAPDKNMGLWRGIDVEISGPVAIDALHVQSRLDGKHAALTLALTLDYLPALGAVDREHVTLTGKIRDPQGRPVSAFALPLSNLQAGIQTLEINARDVPELLIHDAQLWWPAQLGTPARYTIELQIDANGRRSDLHTQHFGIRTATATKTKDGDFQLSINGHHIQVRGAGWSPDMFLRNQRHGELQHLRRAQDLGLNLIRLEGPLAHDDLFELADASGMMILAGWSCCDAWEKWERWDDTQLSVATSSLGSQVRRLARHPSVVAWMHASDGPPPAAIESEYRRIVAQEGWQIPQLSSASHRPAELTGQAGVKMRGPYDYVAPRYWLEDNGEHGGAHGFATEVGPGPSIPCASTLARYWPENSLWPRDPKLWRLHAGGYKFDNTQLFDSALAARYGEATSFADYYRKAQLLGYVGHKAMFEGFRLREQQGATGVVAWMLNSGWPSLIWQLYDVDLCAAGAYYGSKLANRPLHVVLDETTSKIIAINQTSHDEDRIVARVQTFSGAGTLTSTQSFALNLAANERQEISTWTNDNASQRSRRNPAPLQWLSLALVRDNGEIAASNWYWRSTVADKLNWAKSTWYHTPVVQHADLRALQELPPVELRFASFDIDQVAADATNDSARLTAPQLAFEVSNPSGAIAFQISMQLFHGDQPVDDVFWSDNYLTLAPGERRVITVRPASSGAPIADRIRVQGWNVAAQELLLNCINHRCTLGTSN